MVLQTYSVLFLQECKLGNNLEHNMQNLQKHAIHTNLMPAIFGWKRYNTEFQTETNQQIKILEQESMK